MAVEWISWDSVLGLGLRVVVLGVLGRLFLGGIRVRDLGLGD